MQAESCVKFIWMQPRRRLFSVKIVHAEAVRFCRKRPQGLPICRKVSEFYPFFAGEHRIRSVRCVKIPSYGDRFTTFGRRRSLFPASRVFSRSGLFLRRLKISSAVHDEIILEEILFNLLISSVICIFRVEVDDIFRKRWCEWCNNCYLYPINKAGSF